DPRPSVAGRPCRSDDRANQGTSRSAGNGTGDGRREPFEGRRSGKRRQIGRWSVRSSVTEPQKVLDSRVEPNVNQNGCDFAILLPGRKGACYETKPMAFWIIYAINRIM